MICLKRKCLFSLLLANGDVEFKSIELLGKQDNTYEFVDYLIPED